MPFTLCKFLVGLLEIAGGLLGLVGTYVGLSEGGSSLPVLSIVVIAVVSLPFVLSVVAGALLLFERRLGLTLSIVTQALQVVHISTPNVIFSIYMLFYGGLEFAGDGVGVSVSAGSSYSKIQLDTDGAAALGPEAFAVNLVALAILVWLLLARRRFW